MSINALQLFALLPIIQFILIFFISRANNRFELLKSNYALMYLDWLFVPFNFLIPLAVVFSWKLFIAFSVIGLVGVLFLHHKWNNVKLRPETRLLIDNNGLTGEGYVHLFQMLIQTSLIITILFSNPLSSYYYIWSLLFLLMYLLGYLLIIIFVRKVRLRSKAEMPFIIVGIVVVIVRMIMV